MQQRQENCKCSVKIVLILADSSNGIWKTRYCVLVNSDKKLYVFTSENV